MDNYKFLDWASRLVWSYVKEHLDKTDPVPDFKVYPVWLSRALQNNKALLSTTLPDGMYYEVTYNGDKAEIYLDAYKKLENRQYGVTGKTEEL